jgi:hypothetical protein
MHSAQSIFFFIYRQFLILFPCPGVGKTTFLLYCCFNGCDKRRNIGVLTPRCGKNSALWCIAPSFKKSFICNSALCNSVWNSSKKFSCRLRAMHHSVESRLCAMHHCAESQIFAKLSANSQPYSNIFGSMLLNGAWKNLFLFNKIYTAAHDI